MVAMVKEGKNSPQYVYSQRDIEYLEKQGWTRQMAALFLPPQKQIDVKSKRGRPRKS